MAQMMTGYRDVAPPVTLAVARPGRSRRNFSPAFASLLALALSTPGGIPHGRSRPVRPDAGATG